MNDALNLILHSRNISVVRNNNTLDLSNVSYNHKLICWGRHKSDNLSEVENVNYWVGSQALVLQHIALGRNHSCAQTGDFQMKCWGGSD